MMNSIAIKVNHLTKVYKLYDKPVDRLKESLHPFKKKYHKDFYALNDVSFEIKKGETVGIIGKNGAGKSTLLKILTGVLTPSNGHVHINGKIASLLELGAGFNPEYTGLENIYLQGMLMGYPKVEVDLKLQEILNFADIGDFINQPVKSYSSGMYARLAFAVAINVEPDVLIIDEALSVGDSTFQRKCFFKLDLISKTGTTIIFVSHSEEQIIELCNRAIFLMDGKVVLDGEPKKVTGLYTKIMNSKDVSLVDIKKEFSYLNKLNKDNVSSKNEFIKDITESNDSSFDEYFDNNIKSNSMISYESNGALISNVQINTLDYKNVNVVLHEKEYIYSYDVYFQDNVENVRFGMMFKSITGIGLTGSTFPKEEISNLSFKKDTKIKIKWKFKNYYNEGVFLTNAGVHGMNNKGEIIFLHRIHDAIAFKSIDLNKNIDKGFYFSPSIDVSIEKSI